MIRILHLLALNSIRQLRTGMGVRGMLVVSSVFFALSFAAQYLVLSHLNDIQSSATTIGWGLIGMLLFFSLIGPTSTQLPSKMEDVFWIYTTPYSIRKVAIAVAVWRGLLRFGIWLLSALMANLANLLLKGISKFDFLSVLYGLPVLFAISLWQVGASCTRGHKLLSKLLFWFSLIGGLLILSLVVMLLKDGKIVHGLLTGSLFVLAQGMGGVMIGLTNSLGFLEIGLIILVGLIFLFVPSQSKIKENAVMDAIYWADIASWNNMPMSTTKYKKGATSWRGGAKYRKEWAFLWMELAVLRRRRLRMTFQFLLSVAVVALVARKYSLLLYFLPILVAFSALFSGYYSGTMRHLQTGDLMLLPGKLSKKVIGSEIPYLLFALFNLLMYLVVGGFAAQWKIDQIIDLFFICIGVVVITYSIRIMSIARANFQDGRVTPVSYFYNVFRLFFVAILFNFLLMEVTVRLDGNPAPVLLVSDLLAGWLTWIAALRFLKSSTLKGGQAGMAKKWDYTSSILAISICAVLAFTGYLIYNRTHLEPQPAIAGIKCDMMEQDRYHVHVHLDIYVDGKHQTLPKFIGISGKGSCMYWLHTHDDSGIIHVESPVKKDYTLGEFFLIWHKPLSKKQVADWVAPSGTEVKAYVNGKEYTGDPSNIILDAHEEIVLQIGPSWVTPPSSYKFPPNL